MSGNNIGMDRDRGEQPTDSNGPVFGGAGGVRVFLDNLFKGDMELKLLIGVLYAIGVPSYIWGILLNIGTWKADVLFGVSIALMVIYAYFLIRKLKDNDTMRKLKIRREIREFQKGAGDSPTPQSEKFNSRIDRMNDDMFRNFK